jgi:uncharacterized protein
LSDDRKSEVQKVFFLFMNALALIVIFYAGMCLFLYLYQHKLVYFPDNTSCSLSAIENNGTWFYEINPGMEKAVVVYHGNAGRACDRTYLSDEFTKLGYTSLLIEYPGYSGIGGKPSMESILKGVQNMKSYVAEHGYKQVVVFGESIGTGPASYHAKIGNPDRLILVAPFTELADTVPSIYKIFPVRLLLKDNYRNKEWLEGYNGKALVIHGTKDTIVPVRLSENLIPGAKRVLVDAGHNDIYTEDALEKIRAFLS